MSNIKCDYDAFEYIESFLLEQKQRSIDEDSTCQYRGFDRDSMNKLQEFIESKIAEDGDVSQTDIDSFVSFLSKDLKCAVGAIIKDEFYNYDFEGKGIADSLDVFRAVQNSNPNWEMSDNSIDMLTTLQNIHDSFGVEQWEDAFLKLRDSFAENGSYIPQDNRLDDEV